MTEPAINQGSRMMFMHAPAQRISAAPRRAASQTYYWPMWSGSTLSRLCLVVLGAGIVTWLAACAPPAISGGFDSPHPAARLFAARRAATESQPDALRDSMPGLIRNLESDDPAVRLVSAQALLDLTGETFGYRHFDPEWVRAPAVRRWRDAWERGELTLRDGRPIGPDTLAAEPAPERNAIER